MMMKGLACCLLLCSLVGVSFSSFCGDTGDSLYDQGLNWFATNSNVSVLRNYFTSAESSYPNDIADRRAIATTFDVPKYEEWNIAGIALATQRASPNPGNFLVLNNGNESNIYEGSPTSLTQTENATIRRCGDVANLTCNTAIRINTYPFIVPAPNPFGSYWLSFLHSIGGSSSDWVWADATVGTQFLSDPQFVDQFCGTGITNPTSCFQETATQNNNGSWITQITSGNMVFELCGNKSIDDPCNDAFAGNETACNANSTCAWCASDGLCLSECSINPWCSAGNTCEGAPDLCLGQPDEASCEAFNPNCGFCEATGQCLSNCFENDECPQSNTCSDAPADGGDGASSDDSDGAAKPLSSFFF